VLGIKADPADRATRQSAAQEMAQRLGCIIVLKGHQTVISDGMETFVNETGNVALATAGTGDVLAGLIAGFVAQFFKPSLGSGARQVTAMHRGGLTLLDCARLAVHVHGLAGDRWAESCGHAGMLATDLLDEIPGAIAAVRASTVHSHPSAGSGVGGGKGNR